MGQGNAIAHLMPPPFYAYRYVVAKARAPEESIQDQINKILDATADNRYKVEVMPGVYAENITMKQYVDVVAPYGRAVIRPPAPPTGTTTAVTMADDCMLQGMMIDMQSMGSPGTGVAFGDVNRAYMEDCWITNGGATDFGVTDASKGTTVIIRRCRIDSAETGYKKTAAPATGGTTWLYDNRIKAADNGWDIDIYDGILKAHENELLCTGSGANVRVAAGATVQSYGNTLDGNGWAIANDTTAKVYSHNDIFTKVTHAGVDGFMIAKEEPNTYLVHKGMHIQDAMKDITATSDNRYTVRVFAGTYTEAVTMEEYVDIVGQDRDTVIITQPSATVITGADHAALSNVTIAMSAASGIQTSVALATYSPTIRNCIFTQAGDRGYDITVSTGSPLIEGCEFKGDSLIGISQTGESVADGTVVRQCTINTGDTAAVQIENGKLTISRCKILAGGRGLSTITNDGIIWADHCDITGSGIDIYVDDGCTVYADCCSYNDVTNLGTFADLTGCREYTCDAGLLVGEWAYSSGANAVDEARADDLDTMPTIGVVVYKTAPGALTCKVKNYGYLYDSAGLWTAGDEYWLSETDEGEITNVMPGIFPQRAGVAVATDRFKILIGDNLGLVHCNTYACDSGVLEEEWVFIAEPPAAADTVDEAQANLAATMPCIGVVVWKSAPGAITCLVKLRGKVAVKGKNWNHSDDVYIDDANAGAIVNVMPVGGIIQKVAEVKSDAGLDVLHGLILELAD